MTNCHITSHPVKKKTISVTLIALLNLLYKLKPEFLFHKAVLKLFFVFHTFALLYRNGMPERHIEKLLLMAKTVN